MRKMAVGAFALVALVVLLYAGVAAYRANRIMSCIYNGGTAAQCIERIDHPRRR